MNKQAADSAARCAVVWLGARDATESGISAVGLADEALSEIASVARRRWQGPTDLAHELRAVAAKYGLPGVAVVRTDMCDAQRLLLPPFSVAFEPIELDERNPTLRALCADTEAGRTLLDDCPARSTGRRAAELLFVFGLVGVVCATNVILMYSGGAGAGSEMILAAVGALVATAVGLVFRWRSGRWFVLPGKVVVRRGIAGLSLTAAEQYSSRDSVLLIDQKLTKWLATVCRGWRYVSQELSTVEVAALLAAWRSQGATPDVGEFFPP